MTQQPTRLASLRDVGAMLVEHKPSLAQAAVRTMRAENARYAEIEDTALLTDIADHVEEALDVVATCVADARQATDADVVFVRRHAALRARQRVPLVDFMHAIRDAHRVIWDAIAEWTVGRPGGQDVALRAAGLVIEFINRGSTSAAQAYLDAEQVFAVAGDRVRRDLLEDLLAGRELVPGPRLNAAREVGLRPEAPCVVLVAVPVAPLADEYGLSSAAALLGRAAGGADRGLTVVRQDEIVIIRTATEHEQLSAPVKSAWRELSEQGTQLAVAISTRHNTLVTVAGAYQDALAALGAVPRAGGVVALSEMKAFDYLTLRADETVQRLIPSAVRMFVAEDVHSGGVLTETVLSYVRADLNVKAAAEELNIHINTAHHRLARVGERTDYNLRRLNDLHDLLIAIRLFGGYRQAL